jgi:molecular chaperone GrpE
MNDDTKDIKSKKDTLDNTDIKEEVSMDLDHEDLDDHIIEMLGGKKKTISKAEKVEPKHETDEDDIIPEDDTENPKTLIKKLREELKIAQQEKMDIMTNWQRDKADFLNARKRDQETQSEVIRFANQNLILDMLSTLDGYEQAQAQTSWTEVSEVWRKGVENLMMKIYASLQKVGVERYGKVGDVFDPNLHEAIGTVVPTGKDTENTIAIVMQTGYKLHDKVIRVALVQVFQA